MLGYGKKGFVRMKLKHVISFMLIMFLMINLTGRVYADSLKIQYDGKKVEYIGTQVKYQLNGKEIKSKYPGIIMDGVSLASLKDIFVNSGIGVRYQYNKETKVVRLTRGKDVISLTMGSKMAIVNDETMWMQLAPMIIKFKDGKSNIYVPARFLAQNLGYTYAWNSGSGIVSITGEELEKEEIKKEKDKIKYNRKTYVYEDSKVMFFAKGSPLNSANKPGIYINSILMAPTKELFLNDMVEGGYRYDKKNKNLIVELDENKLIMKVGSKKAKLNGKNIILSEAPVNVKYLFSNKSSLLVPIVEVSKFLGGDIQLNHSIAEFVLPEPGEKVSKVEESKKQTKKGKKITNKKSEGKDKSITSDTKKNKEEKKVPVLDWKVAEDTEAIRGNNSFVRGLGQFEAIQGYSTIQDIVQIEKEVQGQINRMETYMLFSDKGFFDVNTLMEENGLKLQCSNVVLEESKEFVFKEGGMAAKALAVTNSEMNSTDIHFSLNAKAASYHLELSPDFKVLTLRIYRNSVQAIQGMSANGNYTITLRGAVPIELKEEKTEDVNKINFRIADVNDFLGMKTFQNTNTKERLLSATYYQDREDVVLTLNKAADSGYYIQNSGNEIKIVLCDIELSKFHVNIPLSNVSSPVQIKDEDDYLNKTIRITLQGDWREFYNQNPIITDYNRVLSCSVAANESGNTVIVIQTKNMEAYKIHRTEKVIGIQLGKASEFYKKVVVIDPGHGGHDTGAYSVGKEYQEKDIVFAVGYTYLKDYFENSDIKVYWTRKGDTFMSLGDRAKFASRIGADLFISVHANAASNRKANGTEVYYSKRNNPVLENGLSSYGMASKFQKNLTSGMKTYNRGVKSNIFVVTNMNTVPAVLLELGFMTNKKDIEMLSSEEKQEEMAEIIYSTIEEIFDEYSTGR